MRVVYPHTTDWEVLRKINSHQRAEMCGQSTHLVFGAGVVELVIVARNSVTRAGR
jgi:hypothetical protein